MGPFEKSMEYLDWAMLTKSVYLVYAENHTSAREIKPDSDDWSIEDPLRLEVWTRDRMFWWKLTGHNINRFPLSIDATARLYYRYRKRNKKENNAIAMEMGWPIIFPLESPDEPDRPNA